MKDLVKVFVNTDILVKLVQEELEQKGIPSIIKDKFQSGVIAGFGGGSPYGIELYVDFENKEKAMQIINDLKDE